MLKSIIAALLVVFVSIGTAQAQVYPRLVGDKDVFKMEDEATKKWGEVLPRLQRHHDDYIGAWNRLKARQNDTGIKWVVITPASDQDKKQREMYEWCSYFYPGDAPNASDKVAAEKFGRLEVRVQVCEETQVPGKDIAKK